MARAVVLPLNTWRTIVKDKNTRHAFDEMFVSIEAIINDLQSQIDALEGAPADTAPHNLLQADIHEDTITDAPSPGSLIKGESGTATDFTPKWFDGLPVTMLPTETTTTGAKYWFDGLPILSLSSVTAGAGTKWTEHVIGAAGTVLRSTGTDVEWADLTLSGELTHVLKNLKYSQVASTVTATAAWANTGLSVTLPMTSSTSQAVIHISIQKMGGSGGDDGEFRLLRDGVELQTFYAGEFTRQTSVYWHVEIPGASGEFIYSVQVRQTGVGPNVITFASASAPATMIGFEVL